MSANQRIDHDGVLRLVAQERAVVIDALPAEEYAKQHLPGALNIPIQEFVSADVERFDHNQAIITYCADAECDLSARAAARLASEGFTRVYEYVGGIAEWGAYGLAFEGATADIARAGDLAATDLPTCRVDARVSSIVFDVHPVAAVVDDERVLLGRVRRDDCDREPEARACDVMSPKISTFRPDVYVSEMAEWFEKRPRADEFIITTPDGRVFGVLYRAAVERVVDAARRKAATTRR